MIALILRSWCRAFHRRIFRPCGSTYRCASCLREWPVPWVEAATVRELPERWATADVVLEESR